MTTRERQQHYSEPDAVFTPSALFAHTRRGHKTGSGSKTTRRGQVSHCTGPGRARNSASCNLQGPGKGVLRTFCFETERWVEVKVRTRFEVRQSRRPPVHRGSLPDAGSVRFRSSLQPECWLSLRRREGGFRLVAPIRALWLVARFGPARNYRASQETHLNSLVS